MDNIITIGKITKAQGIKGEVKIALMTDEKDLYQNLTTVKLGDLKVLMIEIVQTFCVVLLLLVKDLLCQHFQKEDI